MRTWNHEDKVSRHQVISSNNEAYYVKNKAFDSPRSLHQKVKNSMEFVTSFNFSKIHPDICISIKNDPHISDVQKWTSNFKSSVLIFNLWSALVAIDKKSEVACNRFDPTLLLFPHHFRWVEKNNVTRKLEIFRVIRGFQRVYAGLVDMFSWKSAIIMNTNTAEASFCRTRVGLFTLKRSLRWLPKPTQFSLRCHNI